MSNEIPGSVSMPVSKVPVMKERLEMLEKLEKKEKLAWIKEQIEIERRNADKPPYKGVMTDRHAALLRAQSELMGEKQIMLPYTKGHYKKLDDEYRNRHVLRDAASVRREELARSSEGMIYDNLSKPTVVTTGLLGYTLQPSVLGNVLLRGPKDPRLIERTLGLLAKGVSARDYGLRLANGEGPVEAAQNTGRMWTAAGSRGLLTAADSALSAADAFAPKGSSVETGIRDVREFISKVTSGRDVEIAPGVNFDTRFTTYPDEQAAQVGKYGEIIGRYGHFGMGTIATDAIGGFRDAPVSTGVGGMLMLYSGPLGKIASETYGKTRGWITRLAMDLPGFMLVDRGVEAQRNVILSGIMKAEQDEFNKKAVQSELDDIRNQKSGNSFDAWLSKNAKEAFANVPQEDVEAYTDFLRESYMKHLEGTGGQDE